MTLAKKQGHRKGKLPLHEASLRLKGIRKEKILPKAEYKVSPDLVIGMRAAGVPMGKIAKATNSNLDTVVQALRRDPSAKEKILEIRDQLKMTKIVKANMLEGKMWERLEREVDGGQARDVDAIARALLSSEKIQAGVSGEGSASGANNGGIPPVVDLKVLINQILEK